MYRKWLKIREKNEDQNFKREASCLLLSLIATHYICISVAMPLNLSFFSFSCHHTTADSPCPPPLED